MTQTTINTIDIERQDDSFCQKYCENNETSTESDFKLNYLVPASDCHSSQVSTASETEELENESDDDDEVRITIFDKNTDMPEYDDYLLFGQVEENDEADAVDQLE